MQYSFDFTDKPGTPDLDLNHLDYTKLSGFADFSEKLGDFNEKYDMDLVATKGSRWQPGTYNKIKDNMDNIMYPHWKTRRGANNIQKLLERNNWNYNQFRESIHDLDTILYKYRQEGIELYGNDDLLKSKKLLYEILDKFTTEYDDVKISIEPVPHSGRHLRGYYNCNHDDAASDKISRLYPVIDNNNEIIGSHNGLAYDSIDDYQQIAYDFSKEINPAKWFINIRVALRNVEVNLTNSRMDREYAKFPYGDLIVCFTVDLVTLLTNYRRIQAKQHLIKTEYIGTTATTFPIYSGIEHPFVYKRRAVSSMLSWFNSYGNGNICLGDLSKDIYTSLLTGNIELLKSYLNIWANSYSAGVTSPLNSIANSTFGVRKEWDSNVRGIISGGSTTCYNQIKDYKDEEDKLAFSEKFCTECALVDTCKLAKKLGMMTVSWADEADGSWVDAYNVLSNHLINEVDKKKVYEIFADLYYFCKNDMWKGHMIHKVFNSTTNVVDYTDFNVFIGDFTLNGPTEDNIIRLFELYNRNFVLNQVYNDNPQMFDELTKKTHDCTFDEAIEKLTTRTIEDTHYSWLFAVGNVASRDEYYTYIKSLNSRREGIRYEYSN